MPPITASDQSHTSQSLWLAKNVTSLGLWLLYTTLWGICFIACETAVSPFEQTQPELSAYGYLEAQADTHWVRVVPGRKTLARPKGYEGHGIRLSMTDGSQIANFKDTVMTASDGYPALSFYSTQKVDPQSTWSFTLTGPGYNDVSGQVTLPAMLEPEQMLTDAPFLYTEGDYRQIYFFENVSRYFYAEFYYRLSRNLLEGYQTIYYPLSTEREMVVTDRGLIVTIFHSQDRNKILEYNGLDPLMPYYLDEAGVRVIFADENWVPEGGVFDPELLIRPGVFSNLSNGLGFIGGASINTNRWIPVEQHILNTFGFCHPPGRSPVVCTLMP